MNKHVVIAAAVVVLGSLLVIGGRYFFDSNWSRERDQASDAALVEDTLKLGMDSWVGYAPLCADEMARRLALSALGVECVDDAADYDARFKKLRKGDLDLAVTTLDAYLRNYASGGELGPIVAVIDESKGGDAILARKDSVPNLQALKADKQYRIAYTAESPSEFLMISVGQHFGIPFTDKQRFRHIQTDGSNEALKALKKGKADIAVLWEPDVSAAMRKSDFVRLIGSQDVEGLIVDVLVASPRLMNRDPEILEKFLSAYFDTQAFYLEHTDRRDSDLAARFDLNKDEAGQLASGVAWAGLLDNGLTWYGDSVAGRGDQKLLASLYSTQSILARANVVRDASLPAHEVLRMLASSPLQTLFRRQAGSLNSAAGQNTNGAAFPELSDVQWRSMQDIGALAVDAIGFQSGTSLLTVDGREALDQVAETLRHYPKFRIVIRGHTSTGGDGRANMALSIARAESVREYLLLAHPVHPNRLRAEGYGDTKPLPQQPGESLRAYRYRLPRVEISFVDQPS